MKNELPTIMEIEEIIRISIDTHTQFEVAEKINNTIKPIHDKQVLRIKELEVELNKVADEILKEVARLEGEASKLKTELTKPKQKEELDVIKVAEVIYKDMGNENINLKQAHEIATAICSKFKPDAREELDVGAVTKTIYHTYLNEIYTDKPHGLSDKDIKKLATKIVSRFSLVNKEPALYCLSCGKKVNSYEVIKMHSNCGGTLTTRKPDIGMTRYE